MIKMAIAAALAAGAFTSVTALAAPITYTSSNAAADLIHNVQVNYSITTDGTIGDLLLSNIIGSSVTYTGLDTSGDYSFGPFTAFNNLYFQNSNVGGSSPISATAGGISFNFAGGGGFNLSTVNCTSINNCDGASQAAPTYVTSGLVYALAGAQSTDDDSVVFHGDTLPVRELDSFNDVNNPDHDFNLHDGFYNRVDANNTVIATALTGAVPEPATWAMMILGMGAIGFAMRSAKRGSDRKFDAKIKRIAEGFVI